MFTKALLVQYLVKNWTIGISINSENVNHASSIWMQLFKNEKDMYRHDKSSNRSNIEIKKNFLAKECACIYLTLDGIYLLGKGRSGRKQGSFLLLYHFSLLILYKNNNAFIYYSANNQLKILNVNQGKEKEEREGCRRRPTQGRYKKIKKPKKPK